LVVLLIGPEGNLFDFGAKLNLVSGSICIGLFYLNYFPSNAESRLKAILIIHCILSILLLIIIPSIARIPMLILSALIMNHILQKKEQNRPEIFIISLSALFFFFYLMIYQNVSGVWHVIQLSSRGISWLSSIIFQISVNLNPSYSGIHISILFLICAVYCIRYITSHRLILLILSMVYILIVTIIYSIIQHYLPIWVLKHFHSFWVHSLHSQAILFFLLTPLIFYLYSKVEIPLPDIGRVNSRKTLLPKIILYLLIFASVFIITFIPTSSNENMKILFHDNGYLDWRLPDHLNYGAKNGGMFGMLPIYLEAKGYNIAHDSTINNENLDNTDILVIVNLLQEFTIKEKLLILDFVKKGGSLLVMGDHTGFKSIREPTNDLLIPFNIALNFDSAIPFVESWKNSMNYFPHFITSGIHSNYVTNIFIGASLSIRPPARPLITGKFGFSDPGNLAAAHNGYLGDMRYLQGEQLGDQVLVAETLFGNGKVLVFGDTSPFQNSALVQSHTFTEKVFRWLSTPSTRYSELYFIFSLILILLAIAGFLCLKTNIRDIIFISASIVLAILFSTLTFERNTDIGQLDPKQMDLAIIDASHLERLSLNQWKTDGYGGLCYNLMRAGFMPLLNSSCLTESIKESKVVVLIAPAKPFKKYEIEKLVDFVSNGGFLFITSGWEESRGSETLLNEFGLRIENIPLGRVTQEQNIRKLSLTKAWALNGTERFEILCEVWDHPIAIFKPVENGGIFLIGDSGFLLNENLEGMDHYNSQNILFLQEIFEMYYK